MARRRRSPLKKALHAIAKSARPRLGTTTRMTPAARQKKIATTQKKTAAKKTGGPYAAALAIPAQNRAVAAKQAKATQPAKKPGSARAGGAGAAPYVRNPDGTFNGSRPVPTFGPAEQERNRQAWTGYVDPALRPRNPRTRRG